MITSKSSSRLDLIRKAAKSLSKSNHNTPEIFVMANHCQPLRANLATVCERESGIAFNGCPLVF